MEEKPNDMCHMCNSCSMGLLNVSPQGALSHQFYRVQVALNFLGALVVTRAVSVSCCIPVENVNIIAKHPESGGQCGRIQ